MVDSTKDAPVEQVSQVLHEIPLTHLGLSFVPAVVVIAICWRWSLGAQTAVYGMARMLIQLLLVGYVLTFLFETDRATIVVGVLSVMLLAASWISLGSLKKKPEESFRKALLSIATGGIVTLWLITQLVLELDPWFSPRQVIPLAGMIFAGAMNSVSLAAERIESEFANGANYEAARSAALRAAMIPITNSLFAVGIVSLPGMMTGQILSGVDPLVAARYQIMVMCMLFGSAGIAAACYLRLVRPSEASP